jgi:hypothetical protein
LIDFPTNSNTKRTFIHVFFLDRLSQLKHLLRRGVD